MLSLSPFPNKANIEVVYYSECFLFGEFCGFVIFASLSDSKGWKLVKLMAVISQGLMYTDNIDRMGSNY